MVEHTFKANHFINRFIKCPMFVFCLLMIFNELVKQSGISSKQDSNAKIAYSISLLGTADIHQYSVYFTIDMASPWEILILVGTLNLVFKVNSFTQLTKQEISCKHIFATQTTTDWHQQVITKTI